MNQTDEINSIVSSLGIDLEFPIRDQPVSREQLKTLVEKAPRIFEMLSDEHKETGASSFSSGVTEGITKSDRNLWSEMKTAFLSAPGHRAKGQISFWFLSSFDGSQDSLNFILSMLELDETKTVRNFIPLFIKMATQDQWDQFSRFIKRERDLTMAKNVIAGLDDDRNLWLPET